MASSEINFTRRSVARIRDVQGNGSFEVLCYGWGHSELASISEDDTIGGAGLLNRLARRGIDTDRWRANLFETGELKDQFRDGVFNPRPREPSRIDSHSLCIQGLIL